MTARTAFAMDWRIVQEWRVPPTGPLPHPGSSHSNRHSLPVSPEHLLLRAEALDAQFHHVAVLEEARRLLAKAHARRRAGGDDVARVQAHELRQVGDEVRDAIDH